MSIASIWMPVINPKHLFICMFLALGAAAPAIAQDTSAMALAVLAQAKQAAGGAAWNQIAGWREHGRHGDAAYDTLLDLHHYGARFTSTRGGETRVSGYNGQVAWEQRPDGKVVTSHDPRRLAEARQSAYASASAFFLPGRFPAQFAYLGQRSDQGASFDVVKVTPDRARPFEIWIDHQSHLVDRFVDRSGPKPVTGRLSDYRQVAGIKVAFAVDAGDGEPGHAEHGRVDSVALEPVPASAFDPPAS